MVDIVTSELTAYKTLKSNTIYLDTVPAVTGKLTVTTTSDNSNFVFGLSNNGGITFEEVSNGVIHTFTDATGNEVQYQIWGKVPGIKISNVVVKIN